MHLNHSTFLTPHGAPSVLRIPVPNPLAGSDDEPVDSVIEPWLRRGFRVVCSDARLGHYEACKSLGAMA